ncbi:monoamine oxidase [Archangium gephyra]|uniref:Tryptophan 2-monooxygenase n=1 Tax=Archangium gephyra TaxID=48 RepID=A0AAC8Q5J2_9BACT|nr:NAD(P)/FAD-dependent oxidoreductase [Archangium gephyra]AKJ01415.1 amine oxidase [Archangium gephyra]REG34229.1 monoamine oxidase [Archangium gephyra]
MKSWLRFSWLMTMALALQACAGWSQRTHPCAATHPAYQGREAPVVIVGAGLTGLTLAYELKKAGIDALLVEAAPRIGGRVQTIHFPDGATAEAHMEEYFERSPAVKLLKELELELNTDVPHSSVRIDGRIHPYPEDGGIDKYLEGLFDETERTAFLQWNEKAWRLYEQLHASHYAGKPLPPELAGLMRLSFAEFVARDQLPRKVSEWIRVTVEPEMAIEWDQISALDGIDEMRLFLKSPQGFGERNHHVSGGNTRFIEALAARLRPEQLLTQARVTAIVQTDSGVKLRVLENDRCYRDISGQLAVVTIPVNHLGRLQFSPALSPEKKRAIATTRMGSYIKIHLRVSPKAAGLWELQGTNVLTLLSDSIAGSIYDVSELQDDTEEGNRTLTLLLHARFARSLLNASHDEVRDKALEGLENLFPGIGEHVQSSEIFVYPQAVAYWPLELERSRFDALAQELRQPQGRLYIGGDTTEDSHSEGAVIAACRMARQILERQAGQRVPAQAGVTPWKSTICPSAQAE